jgi:hypothetical protein
VLLTVGNSLPEGGNNPEHNRKIVKAVSQEYPLQGVENSQGWLLQTEKRHEKPVYHAVIAEHGNKAEHHQYRGKNKGDDTKRPYRPLAREFGPGNKPGAGKSHGKSNKRAEKGLQKGEPENPEGISAAYGRKEGNQRKISVSIQKSIAENHQYRDKKKEEQEKESR